MTTTPFAQVLVSVNSGSYQTGPITVSAAAVIALTAANKSGWIISQWRVYGPPGWSTPGGWTLDPTDGAAVYTGVTEDPPTFILPAISGWGKWMIKLTVNNGQKNFGASTPGADSDMVDASTALSMVSSNGLVDIGFQEATQFDAIRKWLGALQADLRTINTLLGGGEGGTTYRQLSPGINTVGGPGSNTFVPIGGLYFEGSAAWDIAPTFTFQGAIYCSSGITGEIRLYNVTAGSPIAGSTQDVTNTTPTSFSAAVTLPSSPCILEAQFRLTSGTPQLTDSATAFGVELKAAS